MINWKKKTPANNAGADSSFGRRGSGLGTALGLNLNNVGGTSGGALSSRRGSGRAS